MKNYAFILITILALTSCMRAQTLPQPSPHDLVFEELAESWDEGIPLGNGMMGALVWEKDGRINLILMWQSLAIFTFTARVFHRVFCGISH